MPYCPECGVEYRPGFAECSDCRVTLVDELAVNARPDGVPRSSMVTHAADAVFPILYGIASLACFMMAFINVAADPPPGAHPKRTGFEYWFLGGWGLLIVAMLLVAFGNRRQPRG